MNRRALIVVSLALVLVAGACDSNGTVEPSATTTPTTRVATTSTAVVSTTVTPTTSLPSTTTTITTTSTTSTTVSADVTPPELVITAPQPGATVSTRTYWFEGSTEPGCTVTAAGRYPADVDADGNWSIVLVLNPGGNLATFVATDHAGNTTTATVTITYRPPVSVGDAVALAQARLDALWSADSANPYVEIHCPDADRKIDVGDVFVCQGRERAPGTQEIGKMVFLVLDDEGTTSMLMSGDLPDIAAAYGEAPHGLLCRDLLAGQAPGPFNLGESTDGTAAFLATAYWFLEGRPDRMDADRNEIPCESVFPPDAIAWVWDGGLLTGGYGTSEVSIIDSLHRRDDVPQVPVGSSLVDFAFNLSGGPGVLIETPDGWQLWRGPGGDASWRVEMLPDAVFGETYLRTVAVLADITYVAGHVGNNPAVWSSPGDGSWTEHPVENRPGLWGTVDGIVECGGDVVFTGHHSASNQDRNSKVWGFGENGGLEDVFHRGGGPPGSGTPAPAVYCHDTDFMAMVTFGHEPGASGVFTYSNEIWSSPTGSDWSLIAADTIQPAIRPLHGEVVQAGSALWVVSDGDIVTSSDGSHWTRIDREAAGFEPDDRIHTMHGGGLGLLIVGCDDLGDPIDPVMWWRAGHSWERIDDHPALDRWGVAVVVEPSVLMIAILRSFEDGAPVMWVYSAVG